LRDSEHPLSLVDRRDGVAELGQAESDEPGASANVERCHRRSADEILQPCRPSR